MERAFNNEDKAQFTEESGRMLYSSYMPFHLARNPYYMSSYTFAVCRFIFGYIPPGYIALKMTLLQMEKVIVERMLRPIKCL